MKTFALTNDRLAYNNRIYSYCKAKNEKDLLNEWIRDDREFIENNCKVIRKPKNIILKYGAKYCFECDGVYYYCYEVKDE